MTVAERPISYESYRIDAGDRYLVVDAAHAVPDRGAFVRAACEREPDAEGVLFLAVEEGYAEPRVVSTFVDADGDVGRVTPAAAGCAAAWAVRRIAGTDVLLDTQTGTYRADVADGSVHVEPLVPERTGATATVEREHEDELAFAPPVSAVASDAARPQTERVVSQERSPCDDD